MNDERTSKEIILQETIQNPLCEPERVVFGSDGAFCCFELATRDNEILLNNIRVPEHERGKGYATMGMEWLKSVSERTKDPITGIVEANGKGGGLTNKELSEWYKNLGFQEKNNKLTYFPESLYH